MNRVGGEVRSCRLGYPQQRGWCLFSVGSGWVRYVVLVLWGLLLWGTLSLSHWPWPAEYTICGVWGCGAPPEALAGCHAAWVILLLPAVWWSWSRQTRRQRRMLGLMLFCLGVTGLLAIGLYERWTWYPQAGEYARSFFLRRWAFVVATWTDLPLLQICLFGLLLPWLPGEPVRSPDSAATPLETQPD